MTTSATNQLPHAGAALIVPIMLGAIATNLFIVHTAVAPPLLLLALATFVVWGRRHELARIARSALAAGPRSSANRKD